MIPWAVYFMRQVVPSLSYTFMPVGLSLSIMMLLLGMLGTLFTWALSHYSSPHRHFPHRSPCCGWTGPCVLDYDHQGTLKWSLLRTCPGGYKACLGPHSKVLGREQHGSWANLDLCFWLVGVNGWVLEVSSHYLLIIKTWVRIKVQEGRNKQSVIRNKVVC